MTQDKKKNQSLTKQVQAQETEDFWDEALSLKENASAVRRARNLFLRDYPYERIFLLTGLPAWVWYKKIKTWKRLKAKVEENTLREIGKKTIGKQANEISQKSYRITGVWLDNLLRHPEKIQRMQAKDIKLIGDLAFGTHRVKQLEEGAPTDIHSYEGFAPHELKKYLMKMAHEMQQDYGEIVDYVEPEVEMTPERALIEYKPTDYVDVKVNGELKPKTSSGTESED